MLLVWVILLITVTALLLVDFGLMYRHTRDMSLLETLALSGFWLVLGLAFSVIIYFAYEQTLFADYISVMPLGGEEAVTQYLTIFLVEKSLSLDNLFVIALIFQTLEVPVQYQYRVLWFGMFSALLFRVLLIMAGVYLLNNLIWMNYLYAVILLLGALKLFANHSRNHEYKDNPLTRLINRFIPVKDNIEKGRFFQRTKTGLCMTPLLVAMLLIESADIVLSFDSIPAALAISRDSFIVISANIFSLLGMRALYFAFASAMQQLHYLKLSLIVILLFMAVKMLLLHAYPIDTTISLLVISSTIILGVIASLQQKERKPVFATSPLALEAGRLYTLTFAGLKRIIILTVGVSVLIIGIIMIVTPGPAIVVIPAGLAILATEFVWARIILKKFKHKFVHYSKETMEFFSRNKRTPNNNNADKEDS